MNKKKLQIQQLDKKLGVYVPMLGVSKPATGWLRSIRTSLGMSLQQFADRLSITKQSAREIELREKEGRITLRNLSDAADAMDLQLLYALVPKDGSIDALIDRKAKELATYIVGRTSSNMKLEDQENSYERLKSAVEERTMALKNELPKILWD